jgi:hypothetical protein
MLSALVLPRDLPKLLPKESAQQSACHPAEYAIVEPLDYASPAQRLEVAKQPRKPVQHTAKPYDHHKTVLLRVARMAFV